MSLQKLAEFLKESEQTFHEFDVHYFAKKASDNYIKSKIPLNDSIKKIAEENGLNDEYVRRVCETANHNVNQHLFDTQEDKNIYFKVAEAETILQKPPEKVAEYSDYDFSPREYREKTAFLQGAGTALGAMGGYGLASKIPGATTPLKMLGGAAGGYLGNRLGEKGDRAIVNSANNIINEYDAPDSFSPQEAEEAYAHPDVQAAYQKNGRWDHQEVDDAFHRVLGQKKPYFNQFVGQNLRGEGSSKIANIDFTMDVDVSAIDPKLSLLALKEKIASMKQDIEDKLYVNDIRIKEANYNLYKVAKEELKSAPYYKIAQAIAMTTDNHNILEDITEQLWDEHLISEDDMLTIVKTAGELNTSHPIVMWTKKYASLLEEVDLYSRAKIEVEDQLKLIQENLKF